ncbi:MAG: enoyl-CoA hydratase/isomerase family protein [Spirochaetes bacterium]|nr:enoyl-CoA hydratase/isomerase family protein [Spirochaetota bacterium]HOD15328.1 3-hydroxyacyl-CoA dehydrogenase NAD-binding domain-containing protein [Spirochaetota bacterium]HPG50030.1 3-hydroxyacyl-CoA dehydrogenase NAD-binding domain-containing protein [Spirochaetota bacterium]
MVRRIQKVAVIGSGIMGGGIAALCASAGIPTLLMDIVPFDLKDDEKKDPKARNRIVQAGLDGVMKSKPALFFDKGVDSALVQIGNLEDDFKKLADCDWIVEVVVENLKIKQDLFARIEKIMKKGAIVSTNTSGLPLNKISMGRSKAFKEAFLGTHFFNPVRYMHLLELIPGKETKKEILNFMADFGERILGKGIVWSNDSPNFVGNRIGVYSMVYTMQVMQEMNMTIPEIDALFGAPMGRPKTAAFKTADMVGLDTFSHVANNCYDLCPKDESREGLKLPAFVGKMVEKKWLGNKTKQGFYKKEITPDWKKVNKVINYKTLEYETFEKPDFPCLAAAKKATNLGDKIKAMVNGTDKGAQCAWKVTAGCLIYSANRIPEICDSIVEIDNAMKWGYNWEMGPFETWDAIGLNASVARMKKEGMKVPKKIQQMITKKVKTFYKIEKGKKMYFDLKTMKYKEIETSPMAINLANLRANKKFVKGNDAASLIDLGDGIFDIEFHTKMNAVNKNMVDFMQIAADYVKDNGLGIVFGNQAPGFPGAFSAGGDLGFMLSLAKAKKFNEIDAFIKHVHEGIMGMKYAPIPIVAAPYGMTLGGGCELCLASDKIVAHAELYMGLVEIGAGLVPGGCGMIHLWQRYMASVPASVKLADYAAYFIPAFMCVAQAKVSMSAAEARKNGFLRATDRIVFNKDNLIGEAKKECLKLVNDGYAPPAKKKYPAMGQEAQGMIWAEMLNMRSGGYIPKHMEFIAKKAAYCMSGGEARQGQLVSEEYLTKLEREAFVDLWKTEETQKMAEHILNTGKPLMM